MPRPIKAKERYRVKGYPNGCAFGHCSARSVAGNLVRGGTPSVHMYVSSPWTPAFTIFVGICWGSSLVQTLLVVVVVQVFVCPTAHRSLGWARIGTPLCVSHVPCTSLTWQLEAIIVNCGLLDQLCNLRQPQLSWCAHGHMASIRTRWQQDVGSVGCNVLGCAYHVRPRSTWCCVWFLGWPLNERFSCAFRWFLYGKSLVIASISSFRGYDIHTSPRVMWF